ncbi:MAG: DUF4331 family protein [Candidatus Xenobia bacterium]
MNLSKKTLLGIAIGAICSGSMFLIGCTNSGSTGFTPGVPVVAQQVNFQQVEQLGRPGINEGLNINNDDLNLFNGTAVNQQATILGKVGPDAGATLLAFANFGKDPNAATRVQEEEVAFLPDALRIDTSLRSPSIGVSVNGTAAAAYTVAYANGAVDITTQTFTSAAFGSHTARTAQTVDVLQPAGGRKLEDDVIDLTFSILTNGATGALAGNAKTISGVTESVQSLPGDGVGYQGSATGIAPTGFDAQGHHFLQGQTVEGGACTGGAAADFPYEAPPN